MSKPSIPVDPLSIPRIQQTALMISHLPKSVGEELEEDTQVRITCNGVTLGTANITAVAPISPDRPWETADAQMAILRWKSWHGHLVREGRINPNIDPDSDSGRSGLRALIEETDERGNGDYWVEYQPLWAPAEDWEAKVKKAKAKASAATQSKDDPPKVSDPDADKFKPVSVEEGQIQDDASLVDPDPGEDFAMGGQFQHGENVYQIFHVDDTHIQGEALFAGARPHIVRLETSQVKGYVAPGEDYEAHEIPEFEEPDTMTVDQVRAKYHQAVGVINRQQREINTLADPTKSIVIDLDQALREMEMRHNPGLNRDLDELKPHFVATMQLQLPALAVAQSKQWCALDHMVNEQDGAEDLKTTLSSKVTIGFQDIGAALVTDGTVKLLMAIKGGLTLAIPQTIASSSKTPGQPELFEDKEMEIQSHASPVTVENLAEDDETESSEEPHALVDLIAGYGAYITEAALLKLTDGQNAQIEKWLGEMMAAKGPRKFPTILKKFANKEAQAEFASGEAAFAKGTANSNAKGTAAAMFFEKGYEFAKASAA
jgi:hypothetical protein